jgi:hypothetical protein
MARHPAGGLDAANVRFLPDRARSFIEAALEQVADMDDADSDLQALAVVIINCTEALCVVMEGMR